MRTLTVAVVAVTMAALSMGVGHGTAAASQPCDGPVVLVHDMARSTDEWTSVTAELQARGRCVDAFAYGETPATLGSPTVAGVAALETSAVDIGSALRRYDGRRIDVIAHGAGALAVQYYLQRARTTPVRSLTTIGPMWNGTDIGGLNEIEDISRRLGTYDAVLALEKPVVDPVCGGCRQLITGSDFLVELHYRGLRTNGVRYTDIISDADGLVVPPSSGLVRESETVIVQSVDPGNRTGHFWLTDDPVVVRLAVGALE